MIYIKEHYPQNKFEAAFYSLFPALWVPPQSDLSKLANLSVRTFPMCVQLPTLLIEAFTADSPPEELHSSRGERDHRWGWRRGIQAEVNRYNEEGSRGARGVWMPVVLGNK